jgi:two-component system CheB/CheR fusion protein
MESKFLQNIYNAMAEGLYAFDSDAKITHINPAAIRILGYEEKDLIGKIGHFIFHAHKNSTGLLDCPVYKAFLAGLAYEGESVFITKTGKHIDVTLSATPLMEKETQIGYVVLFRDISEKKRLEKERDAFFSIVKNTDDIIVIKDLSLKVIATNEAFVKVSGKKNIDELIGRTDAEIFGVSETTEPIASYMNDERRAQNLPNGHSLVREEPVIYPNGEVHIFKTRKFPIYKDGIVFATANISMDITQEKLYAQSLEEQISQEVAHREESESFYGKIFETANLGICLTDTQGRFVAVNPAYCKIYGYEEKELIGNSFTMVVPPEHHKELKALHDEFLLLRIEELGTEWEVVRKDGKRIQIYASAGILENIVGGPYKITTISDITEMIQARKMQQEQEALLIQQSKLAAMGEMLGHIAHQWRQPLNVINCTTLDIRLKKDMQVLSDEALDKSLFSIETLTDQMSETINDFMSFYKPDKEKRLFSLYESIANASKIIAAQLGSYKITLLIHVDEAIVIYGCAGEFQQVILNLLTNAKDAFISQEATQRKIIISAKAEDEQVIIHFEDNAGGIDEAILPKIFEPYFTTKVHSGGTGIGLYMSSMIIKQTFKGTLEVNNICNESKILGARFTIVLPKNQ